MRKRVSKLKFNNFENNTCTDVIVQVFVPKLPVLRKARIPPPLERMRGRPSEGHQKYIKLWFTADGLFARKSEPKGRKPGDAQFSVWMRISGAVNILYGRGLWPTCSTPAADYVHTFLIRPGAEQKKRFYPPQADAKNYFKEIFPQTGFLTPRYICKFT